MGYSPWGCKELDTTEHTHTHLLSKLWSIPGSHPRPPLSAPGFQKVNMIGGQEAPFHGVPHLLSAPWLTLPCAATLSQARSTTVSCWLRAAFPRDCLVRLTSQWRRSACLRAGRRMGVCVPGLPVTGSSSTSFSLNRSCLENTPIFLQSQSLNQDSSNFNVLMNYLGILLKCRFCCNGSGSEPKALHFLKVPQWY